MVLGLVPDCPLDGVRSVGNAAGAGAVQALLSRAAARRDGARRARRRRRSRPPPSRGSRSCSSRRWRSRTPRRRRPHLGDAGRRCRAAAPSDRRAGGRRRRTTGDGDERRHRADGAGGARRRRAGDARRARRRPAEPFLDADDAAGRARVATRVSSCIEHNADTILEEVGVEVRDYPSALERFADAGADVDGTRVRFPRGMCRSDRAGDRAGDVHPSTPATRRTQRADRRRRHGVRAELRLAVRPRPRQRPALRHARRLPELREAGLPVAAPPPLRRHGVRAGRRAGAASATSTWCTATSATATSRSWARSPPASGPPTASSWPASRFGGDLADRTVMTSLINASSPLVWDAHDARRGRGLRRRQPGDDHHPVHPRRGDGAGDVGRRRRPDAGRGARRDGVHPARAPRRAGDVRLVRQLDVDADRARRRSARPSRRIVLYTLAALARRLGVPFRSRRLAARRRSCPTPRPPTRARRRCCRR